MLKYKNIILLAISCVWFLCACATTSREETASKDLLLFESATNNCDAGEMFGAATAFNCDLETCIRLAHDRSEESCADTCAHSYDCTAPLRCSGRAAECQQPLVVKFKSDRCESGDGYFCSGACRCACECVGEM